MKNSPTGIFIPAGIFIGMGVGFVTDQLVGGLFIGLGAGFLLMVLFELADKDKHIIKSEEKE